MSPYLKDPSSGKISGPWTAFMAGFAVAAFKLLVSGLAYKGFTAGVFSGTDFAAVVGALGGLYWAHSRDNQGDSPKS